MNKVVKFILISVITNQFLIAENKTPDFSFSKDSTEIRFYYVSGSEHGIWLAKKDYSGNWNRGQKVFINNIFDPNSVDPDIIRLSDGRYRLYFFKGYFNSPPPPNEPHKIYSAVSIDGINFTIENIVFQLNNVTDPSVVQLTDSSYLMALSQSIGQNNKIIFAKSSDGINFQQTSIEINNGGIPELTILNDGSLRIYYNKIGGIGSHRSTNNGETWIEETGLRLSANFFVADPSVIKVNDNQWVMFVKGFNNTGLFDPRGHNVRIAESNDGNTFFLIDNVILDSASVPEGVLFNINSTDVEENFNDVPKECILYQNYPNPFNPNTTIAFGLPQDGFVSLEILNIIGEKVATLINQEMNAGNHKYHFETDKYHLSSGLYFYKLSFKNFISIKKFILLK